MPVNSSVPGANSYFRATGVGHSATFTARSISTHYLKIVSANCSIPRPRPRAPARASARARSLLAACSHECHTLGSLIEALERLTVVTVHRIHCDNGARPQPSALLQGLDLSEAPKGPKAIGGEMHRRAVVEPVIGHFKDDHRMARTRGSWRIQNWKPIARVETRHIPSSPNS